MPATYEPIGSMNLTGLATATFSSISSGFTDLRLVVVGSTMGDNVYLRFNGDTATNYSDTRLQGNGSAAASVRQTSQSAGVLFSPGAVQWGTEQTLAVADVFSYAGSTFKTVLSSISADYNGSGAVTRIVGLWRSASAITSVTLRTSGVNGFQDGTATLYGIKAA